MNKPAILSVGAIASVLLVFAVPSYNTTQQGTLNNGGMEEIQPVAGRRWQCVTRTGPDAPNLVVLRENGMFLKLIDYKYVVDNGTNFDLQGMYDIKQDQLLARISGPSGEIFTDTYTVKHMDDGKIQLTRSEDSAGENTRYSCSMQASRS
ncbi:MAG TPA: hypothetical protein VET88_14785 [Gammaproteobacteria bacterium]|nr:hypothetical protein [Gammaproteobacteria bacterium]